MRPPQGRATPGGPPPQPRGTRSPATPPRQAAAPETKRSEPASSPITNRLGAGTEPDAAATQHRRPSPDRQGPTRLPSGISQVRGDLEAHDEVNPACLTAELDAIDETIQAKHKVDQTLARFSAVHDELAEEEKRRRDRKSKFLPWAGTDEEMEEALSSNSLPIVAAPDDHDPDSAAERDRGDPAGDPRTKEGGKRPRAAFVWKVAAVVVAALVFAATGAGWGAKAWLNGKFHLVDALNESSSAIRNAAGQLGDENFLLVGSDTRIGQSKNDNAGTVAEAGGARADTVMVAHIPKDRSRVIVASIPRDLEVARPACQSWNPKTGQYGKKKTPPVSHVKLNSVYSVGGPKCLDDVIQQLSGLKINHFAGINFGGFKSMVDAVGGVKVCSTIPIHDKKLGTVLAKPGPQVISGTQALSYVRARHVVGDPTSGYGRIKRQQRFLSSLLRKVLSQQVLLSPSRLKGFVDAFASSTKGDNIGIDQLITLAQSMRGVSSGKVTFVTIPTTGYANSRGNEVLRSSENRALFDAVINGTPLPGKQGAKPESQASPAPKHVNPTSVKIQVLNAGNSTQGIAGDTADGLAKQGFQVMQTQNARAKVDHTVIRYAADAKNKAKALAAAVPGATLQQDPAAEGAVILMIGPDFTGLGHGGDGGNGGGAQSGTPAPPPKLSTVNAGDTSCPTL